MDWKIDYNRLTEGMTEKSLRAFCIELGDLLDVRCRALSLVSDMLALDKIKHGEAEKDGMFGHLLVSGDIERRAIRAAEKEIDGTTDGTLSEMKDRALNLYRALELAVKDSLLKDTCYDQDELAELTSSEMQAYIRKAEEGR